MQSTVLYVHILFGAIAVIAGYVALFTKKGKARHIQFGNWFVVTMILMAISGVVIAYLMPMIITVFAGLYTMYLVLTGVGVFKLADKRRSYYNIAMMITSLLIGLSSLVCAYWAAQSETGLYQRVSIEPYIMFGVLPLISAILDIRYMRVQTLTSKMRISRHVWRMCFAMFIAVGSFVGQGLKSAPEAVANFVLVEYADAIILLIMLYWLIKVSGVVTQLKSRLTRSA
ncbi:hypothetical protein PA25_24900 [Pseudoalteromonas sp. A25]|uniref:hypothetical protein n=1 Tax=Pseudoalteromonas sp. A25 TaxID=116092 RepID=UPI001260D475|nr:hypothetical protein [Pseudoalteromonas sp. A25]BBN82505.1 hypothetical protein PA25_24900 [Pseudoalteromonas sp. A25]